MKIKDISIRAAILCLLMLGTVISGCSSKVGAGSKPPISSIEATDPPPDVKRHLDEQRAQGEQTARQTALRASAQAQAKPK